MAQTQAITKLFAPTKAGEAAKAYFTQNGLPNRRNEDFHYTDISRGLIDIPTSVSVYYEYPAPIGHIEFRLFENKVMICGESENVKISEFEPKPHTDIFAQLIYGMAKTGHKIEIPANTKAKISIIRFANSRAILDIEIGENAEVSIIEIHEDGALNAFAAKLTIGEKARLNLYSTLKGGGIDLSAIGAVQGADSVFNAYFVADGGKMVRRNFGTVLAGNNAKVNVGGLYLLANSHFDFTSNIIHKLPDCQSVENIRGLVCDKAHAVFQGKILVAKDAQRTSGNMEHRALMLEDGARVNAKPTLEIYADDVECSHANTIGAIDDSALFYMRSRGISAAKAKALLTEAFLNEVFEDIEDEAQKERLERFMQQSLRRLIR